MENKLIVLSLSCPKCKIIADDFLINENPLDFGWVFYKKKWICRPCFVGIENKIKNR